MSSSCRICGNLDGNRLHTAREMMFGTREQFEYLECGRCGTVQLIDVPDLAPYYPENYYARQTPPLIDIECGWRRRVAARAIGPHLFGLRSPVGAWLAARRPLLAELFPQFLRNMADRISLHTPILDYGSGDGKLLRTMSVFGFSNLTGADKFIQSDISIGNVRIFKRELDELKPGFGLVMLHHSFEHLPDPRTTLAQIHSILAPGGIVLIRVPIINFAWEKYGVDWVQLDPPRHLFLYTERALRDIAGACGFVVDRVVYDSEAFQFFASEQYLRDIPLNDPRSYRGVISESIFTQQQINEWKSLAAQLNAEGRGDQACFFLSRR